MYCPVCMASGHSPDDCPRPLCWATRMGLPREGLVDRTLSVRNTDDGVKGVLRRYGLTPGTTQRENKKLLHDLANSMVPTRAVVFVNK